MIKKEGGKFVLYSADGKRIGSYATKEKAQAQQISEKTKDKEKAVVPENIAGTY